MSAQVPVSLWFCHADCRDSLEFGYLVPWHSRFQFTYPDRFDSGVGIMNYLLNSGGGASGVDMEQVLKVGKALLFSPLIGFALLGYYSCW